MGFPARVASVSLLSAALVLSGCDSTEAVAVRNDCPKPVFVRLTVRPGASADDIRDHTVYELKPGKERQITDSVLDMEGNGLPGTISVSAVETEVGKLLPLPLDHEGSGPNIALAGSDCP